jgi:tetratricopeptide (TPR) repeat protein
MTPHTLAGGALGCLLLAVLCAGQAHADVVFLKDGRRLEGNVVERGDRIFIEQELGGISVNRADVLRIEEDEEGPANVPNLQDLVVLKDGRRVWGDVTISDDGGMVVVSLGERGQVRHPRTAVAMIRWRTGHQEGTAGDDDTARLHQNIARLVDELEGTDAALAQQAYRELLALGAFARVYMEALANEHGESLRPLLADLDRLDAFRRVLPGRAEEAIPHLAERLVADDADERERAVRAIVIESPTEVGPLLLYLVRSDPSDRVRSYAVSQMSSLRCFNELAEVLKLHHGPLRLSAALALGESGIYAGTPILIEALRMDNAEIRTVAIERLREWTGQFFGFRPLAPDQDRARAIERWEAWWSEDGPRFVRETMKEVAPELAGSVVTDEEEAEGHRLWEQASEIIAEVLDLNYDDSDERRPERAERRQRLVQAARLLREALDANPSLGTARMTLAVLLYEELDRVRDAERELNLIVNRADYDPGDPDAAKKFANYHLGIIAMREESWQQATVRFTRALHYDSEFAEALEAQGDAYMGMALSSREGLRLEGDAQREAMRSAARSYETAIRAFELQRVDVHRVMRELANETPDTLEEGQAVLSIRRSVQDIDHRKANMQFKLGRVFAALQNDERALQAFREAQRLHPDESSGRYRRAVEMWSNLPPAPQETPPPGPRLPNGGR